jgi:hypothetical protein
MVKGVACATLLFAKCLLRAEKDKMCLHWRARERERERETRRKVSPDAVIYSHACREFTLLLLVMQLLHLHSLDAHFALLRLLFFLHLHYTRSPFSRRVTLAAAACMHFCSRVINRPTQLSNNATPPLHADQNMLRTFVAKCT